MAERHERSFTISLFGRELVAVRRHRTQHEVASVAETEPKTGAVCRAPARKDPQPIFVTSSIFLQDCFGLLTGTPEENLHAVTGLVLGRVRILQRIVPLQLSLQSVAGATADNESLAAELIRLNEFGMLPLAYFHSHPSSGVSATMPSGTDRRTQTTMETSGAKIIGGIFSRDGFVRFYANGFAPQVRVTGKRVKEIDKNVYRLEIDGEDVPTAALAGSGARGRRR